MRQGLKNIQWLTCLAPASDKRSARSTSFCCLGRTLAGLWPPSKALGAGKALMSLVKDRAEATLRCCLGCATARAHPCIQLLRRQAVREVGELDPAQRDMRTSSAVLWP